MIIRVYRRQNGERGDLHWKSDKVTRIYFEEGMCYIYYKENNEEHRKVFAPTLDILAMDFGKGNRFSL